MIACTRAVTGARLAVEAANDGMVLIERVLQIQLSSVMLMRVTVALAMRDDLVLSAICTLSCLIGRRW